MRSLWKIGGLVAALGGSAALAHPCDAFNRAQETRDSRAGTQIYVAGVKPDGTYLGQDGRTYNCNDYRDRGTGGSGVDANASQAPLPPPAREGQDVELAPQQPPTTVVVEPQPAYLPAQPVAQPVKHDEGPKMRGVIVEAGGGVEGYTGSLAPRISPGPTYGVNIDLQPTKVFGVELGYSGAVNSLRGDTLGRGADVVRNGGQAVATLGLTAAPLQPYILGGVGVNNYQARNGAQAQGYRSDTSGDVPVGAGLRTRFGSFLADARFGYQIPFGEGFAPGVAPENVAGINSQNSARYQATLNLGSTF